MPKVLKLTLLPCLAATLLAATNLKPPSQRPARLQADRSEYYRYQLIQLLFRPDSLAGITPGSLILTVEFLHGDSLIAGVGDCRKIKMHYSPHDSAWHGSWALPWNPPLGIYRAVATLAPLRPATDPPPPRFSDSVEFAVKSRLPHNIPDGFCAMTIESAGNVLNSKLPSPAKESRHWTNFVDWAKYLGADAVWYSVGWTIEDYPDISDNKPWVKENFRALPRLAEECHRQGLKFGGYVGSYLLWGPKLGRLKYNYSLDVRNGRIFPTQHVSLEDSKRRADIVKIFQMLQADSNVDFIGLDYIRPGSGGFETAEEFVDLMNIEKPAGWDRWSQKERRVWVARQVKPVSDRPIRARWQWWQAHRSATAVEKLLAEAGVIKPVWGFTLGWDKGHEHGQDPPMMNDAGLDLDAVMIYESNAAQCYEMTNVWSQYLKGGEAQLMAGQQIDWILLQKNTSPPAPEEFYWRLTDAIKGTSEQGRVKGLFWHDMFRGIRGRKGPHSSQEWLIAGAAAFTKARQELGILPLETRLFHHNGKVGIHIRLLGDIERVELEPLTKSSPGRRQTVSIPDWTRDTSLILGQAPANGLAAYRATWGGKSHRDQSVCFAYYPRPYADNPFRQWQSIRAGGDLLIAATAGKDPKGRAIAAGRLARDQGLSVNYTSIDSLHPSFGNKFAKLIVIFGDSLTITEQKALQSLRADSPGLPAAASGRMEIPGLLKLSEHLDRDPLLLDFLIAGLELKP